MPENNDARDMDVMLGFREVAVDNKVITVREFGLMQGLRLSTVITPLVEDIAEQLADYQQIDDVTEYIGILLALFGKHEAITELLLSEATGQPVEWVRRIGQDGEDLLLTLWVVNRAFFLRRVAIIRQTAQQPAPNPATV